MLAGHEEQVSVRGSFCEPSTQIVVDAVHPAPSPASKYPDIHVQSVIDLLPAGELDPVGHALHTNAPISSLYVSAPHALQAIPECAAVYPALQTHDVINVLALGDVVKTGHAMQYPSPGSVLYEPMGHALHGSPSAPVYPAEHLQSLDKVLPVTEIVLGVQEKQSPLDESRIVPGAHTCSYAVGAEVIGTTFGPTTLPEMSGFPPICAWSADETYFIWVGASTAFQI